MSEFTQKLLSVMEKQYRLYEPYRTLCEMENVSQQDLSAMIKDGELQAIPAIPADWFKKEKGKGLFRQLANAKEDGGWLVSSSTSGDPSYTWRTAADVQVIADAFDRAYRRVPQCPQLAFSPPPSFLERVGQRFAIDEHKISFYATVPSSVAGEVFPDTHFMARLNTLKTIWAMVKARGKGRPVIELQVNTLLQTVEAAERTGARLLFSASILMLYPALKNLPRDYDLGANVYFLTGAGGWDGKKGMSQGTTTNKPQFVEEMCTKFNIPREAVSTNFWDIYGTTENGKAQAGSYSFEHGDYVFETDGDVKLYIINPVTGHPAKAGEQGYPRFVSPYGVVGFAGGCVQQNDIVTVVATNDDGSVKQFTHISRATGEAGVGGVGCAYELVEGMDL
jgi:hypothetical protein